MLVCIIFFLSNFVATETQHIQPLQSSPKGSCDKLCNCKEKDGILDVNCEERSITTITQIQLSSALPFHLNLQKNNLVELRADDLQRFRNAISLNLGYNSIQQLEPGIFSALGSLKKLHINNNFVVTLKKDTFQGLENLEYLQADTNSIRTIEPGAFSHLVSLKVLILNDNSLEFLPANIFRFMPLTHLDLRGNRLQALPYMGLLEHLGRIKEFLLEDNDWACDCTMLRQKIWMENMSGQTSTGEIVCRSPPHLRGSVLSKVEREALCPPVPEPDSEGPSESTLETLSSKAGQVPKVMDADIHQPRTAHCSDGCSCHSYPTAGFLIHCQDIGIRRISDLGLFQQSPTKLILAGNMVQRLHQFDFVAFKDLELLNLANNQIDYIDDETFLSLALLKKLHLNGNRLENISPGMFVGLHSVEYLYLEYNIIKDILPGTFNAMPNLKLLCLNNNRLQTLPAQVFRNTPLAMLNLRNNLFMHIPVSSVLDQLHSLEQIHLQGNPWDCTCDLVAFKQWVERLGKDAVVGTVLCQTPRYVAKVELRTLRLDVLCSGLLESHSLPTNKEVEGTTATATTERSAEGFLQLLNGSVPLSVLILSLLIIFLAAIFCAAGMTVFILHRRRTSRKKQVSDLPGEGSSGNPQRGIYGQKNTQPQADTCGEPAQSTLLPVCRPPTYCFCAKERNLDGLSIDDMKHVCRALLEQERDCPPAEPSAKLRAITEGPSDCATVGDASSQYQNILSREKKLQQLGITDYFRKNIAQLQTPGDISGERGLMEAIMFTRSRKVLVEESTKYFELKPKAYREPDYLEVIDHRCSEA